MSDLTWSAENEAAAESHFDGIEPVLSGDWTFYAFRVHWETAGNNKVRVSGYIAGIKIAEDTVEAGGVAVHFHHQSPLSKVDIDVRLINDHDLWAEGEFCIPKLIGGWNCKSVKTQIAHI